MNKHIQRILGDYNETLTHGSEYLTVAFSPGAASLQRCWRKNALAANFIADYFATLFPEAAEAAEATSEPDSSESPLPWQVELQDQVNFIANELLENAMKFCDRTTNIPISLTLRLFPDGLRPDSLVFEVSNALSSGAAEDFQSLIQELLAEDANMLLLRQLEQNAVGSGTVSRLGFLTIMSDYQARIGWKFEVLPQAEQSPNIYLVTIMVYLKI